MKNTLNIFLNFNIILDIAFSVFLFYDIFVNFNRYYKC